MHSVTNVLALKTTRNNVILSSPMIGRNSKNLDKYFGRNVDSEKNNWVKSRTEYTRGWYNAYP